MNKRQVKKEINKAKEKGARIIDGLSQADLISRLKENDPIAKKESKKEDKKEESKKEEAKKETAKKEVKEKDKPEKKEAQKTKTKK